MENIKELLQFINKNVEKRINIMGNPSNYSSKMQDLYNGALSGKFENDKDAALALYNSTPSNPNYYKLKNRLKTRLINTALFIEPNRENHTKQQSSKYAGLRKIASIEVLLSKGARKTAIELAKKAFYEAQRYELTELSLYTSKKLMRHYGTIGQDIQKFERYAKLTDYYLRLENAEVQLEQYYERLSFYFDKYGPKSELVQTTAIEYVENIYKLPDDLESINLFQFKYYIQLIKHQIFDEHAEFSQLNENAIQYYESKKYIAKESLIRILLYQIGTCIQLKEYQKGEQIAIRCLGEEGISDSLWYPAIESLSYLYLITGQYQKVYDLYIEAFSKKAFSTQPYITKEKWFIKEAFIHFLIQIKKIDPSLSKPSPRKFRISRFINDVPDYSSDKRWRNIPILIIQVLLSLQEKDYESIIDKSEALNAYCYRYLRRDYTLRSNCFIKMLLLIPKADFHKERVKHRSKAIFKKLSDAPMEGKDISDGIEIIPYERLWTYTLDMLDNKIYTG